MDLDLRRKEESALQNTASWISGAASTLAQNMAAANKKGGGEEHAPLLGQDGLDNFAGMVRPVWPLRPAARCV